MIVNGNLDSSMSLSLDDLKTLAAQECMGALDCVGGSRNRSTMKGLEFVELLRRDTLLLRRLIRLHQSKR